MRRSPKSAVHVAATASASRSAAGPPPGAARAATVERAPTSSAATTAPAAASASPRAPSVRRASRPTRTAAAAAAAAPRRTAHHQALTSSTRRSAVRPSPRPSVAITGRAPASVLAASRGETLRSASCRTGAARSRRSTTSGRPPATWRWTSAAARAATRPKAGVPTSAPTAAVASGQHGQHVRRAAGDEGVDGAVRHHRPDRGVVQGGDEPPGEGPLVGDLGVDVREQAGEGQQHPRQDGERRRRPPAPRAQLGARVGASGRASSRTTRRLQPRTSRLRP